MNELWDVYTLTNIAGIAVFFSALSLLVIWLFSSILLRQWHRANQVARSEMDSLNLVPVSKRRPAIAAWQRGIV